MKLVRGAWKILVGIKDALVLCAMLLFFGVLFAALSARPSAASVSDGALVLDLDGTIAEQPQETSAFAALNTNNPSREFRLRDVVRALDKAKGDSHVKAVVLDLQNFGGGYPAAMNEIADKIRAVRDSGKPVLAYGVAYTDSAYRLAANASEIWMDPMGGTFFMGPGGSQLYYKGLLDKLGVNAHVYRVGKYKSFVEPYTRTEASPEAKEEVVKLYQVIFGQWQEAIHAARPKAQFQPWLVQPDKVIVAAQGDLARANLQSGLVDKLGDRIAFGERVAQIAGGDSSKPAGWYKAIKFDDYVDADPLSTSGDGVGILTVAGDIVDGSAKAGSAGGDTIARLLLDGYAKDKFKALVVRIDSPGGSALASERIRTAILQVKAKGVPVVVSMGSVAASGGYWVSTAGDTVFAEPTTITGSIGIFGIIPTFENTLKKVGLTTDGVRTTPLSGQPDILGGTTPQFDTAIQSVIDNGYAQFVARVSQARHLAPARVNDIGQGRVWDGGTARQLGLVDRFGTLDDAVAFAAAKAGLKSGGYHADYLEKPPSAFEKFAKQWARKQDDDDDSDASGDMLSHVAAQRRAVFVRALDDADRLTASASVQARCLVCEGLGGGNPSQAGKVSLMTLLLAKLAG